MSQNEKELKISKLSLFSGELYLLSSALYIYCIDQLILAFVQCKHNFLGFTILRINAELLMPTLCICVKLYVNVVNGYATCISRVWFRQGPYIFHSKCQGKDVHARVFPRCRPKLHYFFPRICPKLHQFFSRFFK